MRKAVSSQDANTFFRRPREFIMSHMLLHSTSKLHAAPRLRSSVPTQPSRAAKGARLASRAACKGG
jgi:hypothetical protein